MRDILFKAKRLDNDEWVQGNVFFADNGKCEICIGTPIVRITYEVDPETVCQYTGKTDKNGVKVFSHDRVNVKYTDCGEQREECATVHWDEDRCCFYPFGWEYYCDGCNCNLVIDEIEVVCNIHDKE